MKIPDKIKVGAIVYKVELVPYSWFLDKEKDCGFCDNKTSTIFINKDMPAEQVEATFVHEVIHTTNCYLEEKDVEFLAQTFYQIIKENNFER